MKKFAWGKVIDNFEYDFDGQVLTITKYHPWKRDGCTVLTGVENTEEIKYHCEELRESSNSLLHLVIAWIAFKNLGLNQHQLVYGICRALEIKS